MKKKDCFYRDRNEELNVCRHNIIISHQSRLDKKAERKEQDREDDNNSINKESNNDDRKKKLRDIPYYDIGVFVRDMTPLQFKKAYKGLYSSKFRFVKENHNINLKIRTFSHLMELWKRMTYYGVIYKISLVRSENGESLLGKGLSLIINGRELYQGINRIGKARYFKGRLQQYFEGRDVTGFDRLIKNIDRKNLSKCVKIKILGICKTRNEFEATEIFWTLYFNREANRLGFNLMLNQKANLVVGDLFKQEESPYDIKWGTNVLKFRLLRDYMNGLRNGAIIQKYKALVKKSGMHAETMKTRINDFFHTTDDLKILSDIISQYLKRCLSRGYSQLKAYKYLIKCGFNVFDEEHMKEMHLLYSKQQIRSKHRSITLNNILKILYQDYLRDYNSHKHKNIYYYIQDQVYYRHYVEYLTHLGFVDIIEADQRRTQFGNFEKKFAKTPTELTIAEILYLKGVDLDRIAHLLNTENIYLTNYSIKDFFRRRWELNFTLSDSEYNLPKLRFYLKKHYLAPEFVLE